MCIFDSHIAGIPCQIQVIHYRAFEPGFYSGPWGDCYPDDPAEIEWRVLDSHGRPASWLERKLGADDRDRIGGEAIDAEIAAANEYVE